MNAVNISYRDFLFMIVLIFSMLVNPVKKDDAAKAKPPGSLLITMTWEQGDYDIDLWVKAPGEKKAIGYSNKNGENADLLKDDTGGTSDVDMNYENFFVRTLKDGEYIVNAHCYNCPKVPITANVEIISNTNNNQRTVWSGKVTLVRDGEERTVIRFRLDKFGGAIPESLHSTFQPLREAKK